MSETISEGHDIMGGDEIVASVTGSMHRNTESTAVRPLVTIATYNEMENLPSLVDEIFKNLSCGDVLVVDDNSPDGTGDWCDDVSKKNPRLRCVHRSGKLGLGTAILDAMKFAIDGEYTYMLNMDADFSHHPRYIPDLIAGMDPAGSADVDVMIGSRYVPGGGIDGWPWYRHFMSSSVNLYARALLSLKVNDCSGGFRCYRTEVLKDLDFDAIQSTGYSFQEEILWRLQRLGAHFAEAPITFVDRQRGQSKINKSEALAALRILASLGFRNWTGR